MRPPEPVPSGEPIEILSGSSTDPPPDRPCPADPFPHIDYPFIWCGVTWFKGPWEYQCDGTWVRRRRLDDAFANRCPGGHPKILPSCFSSDVQAERWTTFRDAFGEPPAIPTQEDVKAHTRQRPSSTDPSIPAQFAGEKAPPRILEFCCSENSRIGRDELRGDTVADRLTEKINLLLGKGA